MMSSDQGEPATMDPARLGAPFGQGGALGHWLIGVVSSSLCAATRPFSAERRL